MLLDPNMDAFTAPTKSHAVRPPSDTSFPTVYPDPPIYQHAGSVGDTTLWVVFAFFVAATVAFAVLAWTVPAVSASRM
jgi:hypothetical protein